MFAVDKGKTLLGGGLVFPFFGADEVAAPFDDHGADGHVEHFAQEWDIFVVELALQRFIGGGDDDRLATQYGRDQVGD